MVVSRDCWDATHTTDRRELPKAMGDGRATSGAQGKRAHLRPTESTLAPCPLPKSLNNIGSQTSQRSLAGATSHRDCWWSAGLSIFRSCSPRRSSAGLGGRTLAESTLGWTRPLSGSRKRARTACALEIGGPSGCLPCSFGGISGTCGPPCGCGSNHSQCGWLGSAPRGNHSTSTPTSQAFCPRPRRGLRQRWHVLEGGRRLSLLAARSCCRGVVRAAPLLAK